MSGQPLFDRVRDLKVNQSAVYRLWHQMRITGNSIDSLWLFKRNSVMERLKLQLALLNGRFYTAIQTAMEALEKHDDWIHPKTKYKSFYIVLISMNNTAPCWKK